MSSVSINPKTLIIEDIFNIERFFKVKNSEEVKHKVKNSVKVNDKHKEKLSNLLVDRWLLFELGKDEAYVKHIVSGKKGLLYQIILSGQIWDGIYEFSLRGKKINTKGYISSDSQTLVVESKGNYDLAMFKNENGEAYSICRYDFENDEEFKDAILNTGYITEKEFDLYYKSYDTYKERPSRDLPHIIFE